LGIAIPIVGIATTIAMGRLRLHEGRIDTARFLIIPLFDMVAFSVPFGLPRPASGVAAIVYRE
jgi:hypothetical protein